MRNIIKLGTVLVAAAMLFSGCGNPMVPLTEDEEAIVVNYSAGILAKHNSFQQEGMTAVYPEEESEESEETDETEEPEKTEEPEEEQEDKKEKPQKPEEQPEDASSEEGSGQLTLTEALAVPEIEFSYHDYSTTDNYSQGDYFSLNASPGKVYLLLNVNMTNTGSKAAECDILTKQPTFILSLNGEAGISNEMTMLTNDLSVYKGTLDPGQTEATVLLFEVAKETAENITSIQLSAQINGSTNEIILK